MTMAMQKSKQFDAFKIKFNETSVATLFKKYESIGFIYPAKKALLQPYFDQITKNWKRLLQGKEDLLWILTNRNNEAHFASISVWKQSNYGLMAQHLVSDGNPFLSLKVMLAAQFKAEHHYNNQEVRSSQNWFRPDNRYAYRIFASMFKKLGPNRASLIPFHYLHLKLDDIAVSRSKNYSIEEVTGKDAELIRFVKKEHGAVFLKAEELDQEDIQFSTLGKKFQKHGLHRSRKVLKIKDQSSGKVMACIVANRAPLGLNFSFLENRAYYILDKNLKAGKRHKVLKAMNQAIQSYYNDLELQAIPIVTDEVSADLLEKQGAVFFKKYMQSIWLREGFPMWYDHIHSFLQKIEARMTA